MQSCAYVTVSPTTPHPAGPLQRCKSNFNMAHPLACRSSGAWHGPAPRMLLDKYCESHAPLARAAYHATVPDMDMPGEGLVAVRGCSFSGEAFEVQAGACECSLVPAWVGACQGAAHPTQV